MCVKTKIRLLFVSFLGTDYAENTDFLCSFSVKSAKSVPKKEIVKCILTHPRYTMANQTDVQIAHRKYLIVQDIQSASTSNGRSMEQFHSIL